MSALRPPAVNPCGSCPYRQDVPSGVWEAEEYEKLPRYDGETFEQVPGVFLCHQQDGRVCAGWAGCHDMSESLALRVLAHELDGEVLNAILDYETETPLWANGAEAAEHGMADVEWPADDARRVIDKLTDRRDRRV